MSFTKKWDQVADAQGEEHVASGSGGAEAPPSPAANAAEAPAGKGRLPAMAEGVAAAGTPEQQAGPGAAGRGLWGRLPALGCRLRVWVPAVLVTLVYVALTFFMFLNAGQALPGAVSLSLRYESLLMPAQVAAAKQTLGNPELTADFTPVFWYTSPEEVLNAGRGEVKTPVLFADGDMSGLYPTTFLHGWYPSAAESRGLALSEGLAWELLGSTSAIGAEVEWQGQTYTVRGIFKGDAPMLLAQVDAEDTWIPGFSGVELYGLPEEGDPREAAVDFAASVAGLGQPTQIVNVKTLPEILMAMAWVPAAILGLWFLAKCLGLLRHANFWLRQVVWFGLLFAAAIALPRLLAMLPGWVIPTQWSNLDHWREFFKEISARLTAWLSMKPSLSDVELKRRLIGQVAMLIPALFALFSAMRRWGEHMRRREQALAAETAGEAGLSKGTGTVDWVEAAPPVEDILAEQGGGVADGGPGDEPEAEVEAGPAVPDGPEPQKGPEPED